MKPLSITELFEIEQQENKKILERNKWGNWSYNKKTQCLEFWSETFSYEVDLEPCKTKTREKTIEYLGDWIYHMRTKNKQCFTNEDIGDFVDATIRIVNLWS